MSENAIIASVWIGGSIILVALVSWLSGAHGDEIKDPAVIPVFLICSLTWPLILAFTLVISPFLAIHHFAKQSRKP